MTCNRSAKVLPNENMIHMMVAYLKNGLIGVLVAEESQTVNNLHRKRIHKMERMIRMDDNQYMENNCQYVVSVNDCMRTVTCTRLNEHLKVG